MRSTVSSAPSAIPRSATPRTDRPTFGHGVAQTGAALGVSLMPWQRQVFDTALEHDGGVLAYRTVGVSVPRQAGKSLGALVLMLYRMLAAPGQRVVYGAQTRLAARGKLLDDWWPIVARSPLAGQFTISRVNGSEAMRARNGSMLALISGDETSGHGQTLDLVVLDEVWSLDHRAEQAVRPAMATRGQAQMWLLSTAGTERSLYWNAKIAAGRQAVEGGLTDGLAWFEWSAPPGTDVADPATWPLYHPALGHTITERVIAADQAAMDPHEFARAYGNLPASESMTGWGVIRRDDWEANRW